MFLSSWYFKIPILKSDACDLEIKILGEVVFRMFVIGQKIDILNIINVSDKRKK